MVLSERDVAVLRLTCWCQYVLPDDLSALASETELHNLVCTGLLKYHGSSGALVLTGKGTSLLLSLFPAAVPTLTQSYHKDAITRRLRLSHLALTAYQASVNLFTMSPDELHCSPTLFLSALTRSRGSNPWGSTRVAALAHLGDCFYAVHYVCPGIGRIALTDELTAFTNQTAHFSGARRAFLFAGESYEDILMELESPHPPPDTKLIHYGDAYYSLGLPVHLLSCNGTGIIQLQIMAQPDYRRRLTQAALKAHYQPPPADAPAWDAVFNGTPFVLAADMDLRRINAALKTAHERGCSKIAMAALEGQADAVLFARYRDTGMARVFVLTAEALTEALGFQPARCTPSRTQYLTEKGDVVDAPPIQTGRKAGRPR